MDIGEKYLLFVIKENDQYVSMWNGYKVIGSNLDNFQLTPIHSNPDEAMLQVFINSGGIETDFKHQDGKLFWNKDGEMILIYDYDSNKDSENNISEVESENSKNILVVGLTVFFTLLCIFVIAIILVINKRIIKK
jgi:hypothetical protein